MQRRLTVVPRLSSSNRSSSPGALLLLSILLLISLSLLGCWGSFQLGKQTRLVFHRRYQHHKLVPFSPSGEGALLSQTRDDSRVTSAGERSIQKYHPQESPLSMKNHSRVDSLVAVNKSLLTTTRRVLENVRATSAGQGKKTILPSSLEWNSESRKRRHVDNMLVRTAAYYEVFVHTALLLQDERKKPRRVAIIVGGGHQHGGAMILREVLKHVTVEEVVMIGGTPTHSSSSSFWNDCSELKGSPKLCSDDPRITNGDETLQSFILQFQLEEDVSEDELFDVILVDTL